MQANNFLKQLSSILSKQGCSQIEFYEPKDVQVMDGNSKIELKEVYKVHYLNGNYKFVNFYFTFDNRDWLVKASNQNSVSHYLDLFGKEKAEREKLLELYLDKPSVLGLNTLIPSLQIGPVLLLEKVTDGQLHIFVHILKNKNMSTQSLTNFDCLFIDTQEEFFNKFLTMWI
ncbi:hypothetical protein [Spiroplasma diminutum]|uniref:Uncharacterized protein n=1 Tax=Spiroplasma diminutum CUAS-1 TaxID=1276221 RepID=S5M065_9MOLU|nr:hypothetical protein [Spiroplasma diminutum]AGR42231.1 hypothetical protein SDIMI_v3c05270 [Spiroplasma diminutum CUAS-1]